MIDRHAVGHDRQGAPERGMSWRPSPAQSKIDRTIPEAIIRRDGRGLPWAASMVMVVVTALFASSLTASYLPWDAPSAPDGASISYTYHPAISISGDSQFNSTLYPSNGVVAGNGTASDPYLIEGWEINTTSGGIGIRIQGTTSHFVVRDCLIRGADSSTGVWLMDVVNGVVDGNNCSGHYYGIRSTGSSDCAISDNNASYSSFSGIYCNSPVCNLQILNNTCVSNPGQGIFLSDAVNSTIAGNDCSSGSVGVLVAASSNVSVRDNVCTSVVSQGVLLSQVNNCSVSDNDCDSSGYGVIVSESPYCSVSNNSCASCVNYGVLLSSSPSSTVADNDCSSCYYGVIASNSPRSVVRGNNCTDSGWMGIEVTSSSNSTVAANTCSGATIFGIYISSSVDSRVENNSCWHNDLSGMYLSTSDRSSVAGNHLWENLQGIWVVSSGNCEMQLNMIENQTSWGVRIEAGSGNAIWNNTFAGNGGGGPQACDNGTANRWNTSGSPHGYGNYWSDWTSPDEDSDGVVDDPYVIGGTAGAVDHYPLTYSPTVPIPEFSSVPVFAMVILGIVLLARAFGRGKRS